MKTEEEYQEIAENILECIPSDIGHFEEIMILDSCISTLKMELIRIEGLE